jgi:sensor histidine kinase regulating citrate/malate metabolism
LKQNRVDYCSRTPNESEQQIQQTNEQRKKEHKIKIQFRIYYLFVALQENNSDIGFVSCCNKRKTIKSFQRRFEKVVQSSHPLRNAQNLQS